MAKTFYTDYALHSFKYYTRNTNPVFYSDVDKENWKAADKSLSIFLAEDRKIIFAVFKNNNSIATAVKNTAYHYGISEKAVWNLVKKAERLFAQHRGLIK